MLPVCSFHSFGRFFVHFLMFPLKELAMPKAEKPKHGFLIPNVTLPPLCSSKIRPGPPGDEAQVMTHLVADTFVNSGCLDLSDLCVEPERLVWVLHCDMVCLDHDGGLFDACVISLVAALKTGKQIAQHGIGMM